MNKLSPQKYIIKKGRELPFYECYVTGGWQDHGLATFWISRKMHGGNYIAAFYLVDVFCLGLKNTNYRFNIDMSEYRFVFQRYKEHNNSPEKCDLSYAHNMIYGAIDFAEEIGFKPHKDFTVTEYLLDPDLITDGIDEIEFGNDGKPFYISGPNDNVPQIIRTLENSVGKGNYEFLARSEQFEEW